MILRLTDSQGDPLAVESDTIYAIGVGRLSGPVAKARQVEGQQVTLIYTRYGELQVGAPFDEVLALWQGARLGRGPHGETLAEMRAANAALPGVFPLVVHQHPELLP